MSDANGTPPYRVSYTKRVLEKLQEYGVRADRINRRAWFVAALKDLEHHLQTDPLAWGDPQYGYHKLDLTLYRHYGPMFVLYYAVHNVQPVVFVQDVELPQDSPLTDASD